MTHVAIIFHLTPFLLNRPTGPIQSQSCNVCMCVCVYVCISPLVYRRLNVFLFPFTKVLGQFFFGFFDFLGKNNKKEVVSDLAILPWKWSKIAAQKKVNLGLFFNYHLTFFILQVGQRRLSELSQLSEPCCCEENLSFHWRGLFHIPSNKGGGG